MRSRPRFTTASVLELFTSEINSRGGTVTDSFHDTQRLFARSVLDQLADLVRRGDRFHGGVALRASETELWLHPYLFRVVCRNGAIIAQTLQTRHFDISDDDEAVHSIREAVQACCAEEVFTDAVHHMRTAAESQVDLALSLLPLLSRSAIPAREQGKLLFDIVNRFHADGDQSRFGLVNAVTSVARDTRDPELRWNLEEVGGNIAVLRMPDVLRELTEASATPIA